MAMDSVNSFKGYGKVDEVEEQAFRQKTRRRCIILTISLVVLLVLVIGAVVGTLIHKNSSDNSDSVPTSQLSPASVLDTVCSVTQNPASCIASLKSYTNDTSTDPEHVFKISLKVAIDELGKLSDYPSKLAKSTNDTNVKNALLVCEELFDDAMDRLNESISSTSTGEKILSSKKIDDVKTWLSTTITDQETCLDGLRDSNATFVDEIEKLLKNSTMYASNSLAIVAKILGILTELDVPMHRKLLTESTEQFPNWLSIGDRRLLQQGVNLTATVTVAKDGSGNFKTIKEAVDTIPKKSLTRYVIYVKEGVYEENIVLDKSKWNVMIYGDGMYKTVVSGSLNNVDGIPTFSTATFAAVGKNFIARDIGFKNTAGAAKHQAVAFRSGSDFSVFFRCSFDAYQDTLYAHSNRQFYRDCTIIGTIDFIFGNAAVVFQNCKIMPRQPLSNQFNTITAQGKKDPNQNTGISIHKCTLSAYDTLTADTYLGRPWKDYSTTIVMQSTIVGSFLNPLGWKEWVSGVEPAKSIFYAEYLNTGAGASVAQRVKWAGYKSDITANVAAKFTVGTFIQGGDWLPATTVTYDASL